MFHEFLAPWTEATVISGKFVATKCLLLLRANPELKDEGNAPSPSHHQMGGIPTIKHVLVMALFYPQNMVISHVDF